MIEVYPNLFVGSSEDLPEAKRMDAYVIHAAKLPWHQQAVGYTTKAAPKDHPEYLVAARDGELNLNLIDAPDPAYIPAEVIDAAVLAIRLNIDQRPVLVHCNKGMSRAPTIAMLYMHRHTGVLANISYEEGVERFKAIYPDYAPAAGMEGFARAHW